MYVLCVCYFLCVACVFFSNRILICVCVCFCFCFSVVSWSPEKKKKKKKKKMHSSLGTAVAIAGAAQPGFTITIVVLPCTLLGLLAAVYFTYRTARIPIDVMSDDFGGTVHMQPTRQQHGDDDGTDEHSSLLDGSNNRDDRKSAEALVGDAPADPEEVLAKVHNISTAIAEGADAFLKREYAYLMVFIVLFSAIIIMVIGLTAQNSGSAAWIQGTLTAVSFVVGSLTSVLCGYVGMKIAVYANSRTAMQASQGYADAFITAFQSGAVMGFALVSCGVLVLYILVNALHRYFDTAFTDHEQTRIMFETLAGYGLGGSSIALFGRVGGGIYTKAADVGADLSGKLEFDIPEDDPRNPAVIADNVGDNVGDIAGMGADLFGSFAEATCAAMVISAESDDLSKAWSLVLFPVLIPATGIVVSFVTSLAAIFVTKVTTASKIEPTLKMQLLLSSVLMTPVVIALCEIFLPDTFAVSVRTDVTPAKVYTCILCGLWAGLLIGYITEYYTSHSYTPVREVARSSTSGAATNIIYGLALGYKSTIIPAFAMAVTIFVSYKCAGMYGIAMAALGILSTLATGLTIDAYGPICDNAGGIAEMAGMGSDTRDRTDALDAAGNTTAAIGKGFAIGSAAFVSLALFGGFVTIVKLPNVDLLQPGTFAGLLVGAMLPYWFSAMTMKSVGKAALAMVEEVRHQLTSDPGILKGTTRPDYSRCVDISTQASLRAMIAPGALVMITPLVVGFLFGVEMLAGVLAGALVSGVQMAVSAANTGGAWDNAKKLIESGEHGGKGSTAHHAAVIGDTVGDPLKDTSGPSLNILIKLMAIISLVFARSFPTIQDGGYVLRLFN
jgi:H+-translocating diphosphatase